MSYFLKNAIASNKDFIYDVKKTSNYNYVKEIWGWDEEYQRKDFESDFFLENFMVIAVEDANIGFLQIIETDSNIDIIELHITPKYQGYGIGRSIITNIIEKAISKGKTVSIGCFIKNVRAKDLYEQLGFKVIKKTTTHFAMTYSKLNVN